MGNQQKIIDINKLKTSCKTCSLSDLCLPRGLDNDDLEQLSKIIKKKTPLKSGEFLFQQGHNSEAIYAVSSGAIKTYYLSEDGTEQILGFHLPGELVGLDSLADDSYHCSAKALCTSSYCELPIKNMGELCHSLPGMQRHMLRIMGEEVISEHDVLIMLGTKNAEERLATLLISLSERYKARGMSSTKFNLPMPRIDIANYLGLTAETVSRLFSKFQELGLLKVEQKLITIQNIDGLMKLVSQCTNDLTNVVNK